MDQSTSEAPTSAGRRAVLTRGASLGGAFVPAALAAAAEPLAAGRGPFDVRAFGARGDGKALDRPGGSGPEEAGNR
jgi:hypothetical protein